MNVTFTLDDRLLDAAKILAARRGTSVAALVRQGLERQVSEAKPADGGAHGAYETLLDYSLGRLPRSVAMQSLGLTDYGALLRMLAASGLALPIVPTAEREQQVEQMLGVLRDANALPANEAIAPTRRNRRSTNTNTD